LGFSGGRVLKGDCVAPSLRPNYRVAECLLRTCRDRVLTVNRGSSNAFGFPLFDQNLSDICPFLDVLRGSAVKATTIYDRPGRRSDHSYSACNSLEDNVAEPTIR